MSETEAINKHLREYIDACNAGDLDALMETMTDDIYYSPPDKESLRGQGEVRQWVREEFLDPYDLSFNAVFDDVEFAGNRAYAHGTFEMNMSPKEGGENLHVSGDFFDILVEEGDGWKLKHCIFNSDQPVTEKDELSGKAHSVH